MALHTLPKLIDKKKRRVGQGHGSGRVKTSGRGTKGQKARNSVPITFEGGALPLIKRLPFLRGKMKNKSIRSKPVVVNLSDLSKLPKDSTVNLETLVKHRIVKEIEAKRFGVKILGDGEVNVSLKIALPVSEKAKVKIEKANGTIVTTA
jgi:large subunit ribosomal protein L15